MRDLGGPIELLYENSIKNFEVGSVLKGRIVRTIGEDVLVDVGYKSEGVVAKREFRREDEILPGKEVEVLLESVEDEEGVMVLSKRKADRIRGWERVIETHREGDVVTGTVTRKIKGGLLVDIGVPVFLPASQVNIRRPGDIAEYIGREIQAKILKIDEAKRNIVISRRKLIEEEREKLKRKLMQELAVGQVRKGVVKNIADFGAFVDLGGIDGLLHITDMSWGRVSHPSEVVKIDEEIEVMIIGIDREREKVALGLKQRLPSPWAGVEERYPVGSRHVGKVVNIVSYGAFVKLEDGVEGLVHISEMSWTRRLNHPSEMMAIGDDVEVVVLAINRDKQEISLGMKQTEVNPWMLVEERYPPGTVIEGKVRNLTNYGAFVEIEEGIDGLLHVSDVSWTKKVNHPSEALQKGDTVRAVVLAVDQEKKRVSLGMRQLKEDPWLHDIPSRYQPGDVVKGKVTKVTNFGVFVEIEPELEGLLHISELADRKVEDPQEVVKIGDEVEVRVLRVDIEERKIGLSLRPAGEEGAPPTETAEADAAEEDVEDAEEETEEEE
ncbi:MAG: 30S ribosomal protein S1 [Planctomycetota bacterium]